MPINCYTGLMGSGKSFESVRSVIIPAIMAGRDVITNVEGIDGPAIREYCMDKHGKKASELGNVRHCTNEQIDKPQFFPVPITDELGFEIEEWIPLPQFTYYCRAFKASQGKDLGKTGYQILLRALSELKSRNVDIGSCLIQAAYQDGKAFDAAYFNDAPQGVVFCDMPEMTDSVVKPGDMVVIDEAWRFWGTQCKISGEHRVFFREHRHYVSEKTHVSCDLVLMVQDISDLHRTLKVVVEMSFRTTKLKSLGLSKTYRVEIWEGYKLARNSRIGMEVKKYDPEIFPLYSSYTGGKGVELQVDSRQNIFSSKKLWVMSASILVMMGLGIYMTMRFFDPASHGVKPSTTASTAKPAPGSAPQRPGQPLQPGQYAPRPLSPIYSQTNKIIGEVNAAGEKLVVIQSQNQIRYVPAYLFKGSGYLLTGIVDGETVTYFTASNTQTSVLPGQ